MDRNIHKVIEAGLELSPEERVKVADALMESVPDPAVDSAWRAEIKRRIEEYRRGEGLSMTREESMADAWNMIEEARRTAA